MFADKLGDHIVQSVTDLLFNQLNILVGNTNKLTGSRVPGNASEVKPAYHESQWLQELKQNEAALCYFITFLRRVAVTKEAQQKLVSISWLDLFFSIISFSSKEKESPFGLRARMLTLHLLTLVLPACENSILIERVSSKV